MIKIENTQVMGWEAAIRGARNPMNSWERSDSEFGTYEVIWDINDPIEDQMLPESNIQEMGPNDHKLLINLCKGGTEEAKWRRMVHVQMDITAPLYWWKEFETYKVGTVSNSCSTMHKIHAKEFTLEDFSCEHLFDQSDLEMNPSYYEMADPIFSPMSTLEITINALNACRERYLQTQEWAKRVEAENKAIISSHGIPRSSGRYEAALAKKYWWQMIQLLPSSYNQRRTIDLNYEVLAAQYRQRKDHKLDEWRQYCEWIKTLPYSEFITLEDNS